jgi:hypothetical protein
MMGDNRVSDPAVQARIDKLRDHLDSKKTAAAGRLAGHQAGLSEDKHRDLRALLTKVQVALREGTSEEPAHGLDNIARRINNASVQMG